MTIYSDYTLNMQHGSVMETVRITFDGIESDNQGIILAGPD